MGVIYTNRHARARGRASDIESEDRDESSEESRESSDHSSHLSDDRPDVAPQSDPLSSSRQLLKNLRPRLIYLRPVDRVLLELALSGERSRRGVARALGIEAGTVTRRLSRLIARLSDGLTNALLAETCPLDADLRQLALEHFLGDQSQRELADLHRMTRGAVSRALQYVRGWYAQFSRAQPTPSSRRSARKG